MCLFLSLIFLGPRAVIFFWWLFDSARWALAFDNFIVPILGFLFLPWTTVMYVLVAPGRGLEGLDWVWMGIAVLADLASYGTGLFGRRGRAPSY